MIELSSPPAAIASGLSPEQIQQFEHDGYLIVKGLIESATVAAMRAATERDLRDSIEPIEYEADLGYPGAPPSRDALGGKTVRRLKYAIGRNSIFTEWMLHQPVLTCLKQLLGPVLYCPLAHHNCVMTKHPDFSTRTGWHQDIRYWSFTRPHLVNAWIPLGTERPENGCLQVIPGSHRMSFARHQFDDQLFFRDDLPENQAILNQQVDVELDPTDLLFFHTLSLHAANRNSTSKPKLSAVFTFHGAGVSPLPGTRSSSLPELCLTPGLTVSQEGNS